MECVMLSMTSKFRGAGNSGSAKLLARRIYMVTVPAFTGPHRKHMLIVLAKAVLLMWAYIFVNVQVSHALKGFQNHFEGRDVINAEWGWLFYALWLALMSPLFTNYNYYRSILGLDWRRYMTPYLLEMFMQGGTAYRMNADPEVDNPEQRIIQNVKDYSLQANGLFFSVLEGLTNLVFFTPALIAISPLLTLVAFLYPAFGSTVAIWIARALVALSARQDKLEADIRWHVGFIRQHAYSIALLRGEVTERESVDAHFDTVTANFEQIVIINKRLQYFTTFYNYMVPLVPFAVLGWRYIEGSLTWGDVAAAGFIFAQMYNSAALIVSGFGNFSDFASTTTRLGSFMEALYKHFKSGATGIRCVPADHFGLADLTAFQARH